MVTGGTIFPQNLPMPEHIGIVACSAEGAALCYRTICTEGAQVFGAHAHPEVSIHTPSLAEYVNGLTAETGSVLASGCLRAQPCAER
jgi:hypothetical protein